MATYFIGYSIGSVLAGFIAAICGLAFGKLVRMRNPWSLAFFVPAMLVGLGLLSLVGILHNPKSEDLIFLLSCLPALFWSLGGWSRCRKKTDLKTELPY